jgi:hypothetical protein
MIVRQVGRPAVTRSHSGAHVSSVTYTEAEFRPNLTRIFWERVHIIQFEDNRMAELWDNRSRCSTRCIKIIRTVPQESYGCLRRGEVPCR